MGRTKRSIDEATLKAAQESLAAIPDARVTIRLFGIINYHRLTTEQVSEFLHTNPRTLFRWIERFKAKGVEGIADHPKGHRRALLGAAEKAAITTWIIRQQNREGHPVHWTLKALQHEIMKEFSISIDPSALSRNLRAMGVVLRKPRPTHADGDPEKQEAFKKNERRR